MESVSSFHPYEAGSLVFVLCASGQLVCQLQTICLCPPSCCRYQILHLAFFYVGSGKRSQMNKLAGQVFHLLNNLSSRLSSPLILTGSLLKMPFPLTHLLTRIVCVEGLLLKLGGSTVAHGYLTQGSKNLIATQTHTYQCLSGRWSVFTTSKNILQVCSP